MKEIISVVGLGYVGLPLAVALKNKGHEVIAFDINEEKVNQYRNGKDITKEVGDEKLVAAHLNFTTNPEDLRKATVHLVAVPTPVESSKMPNLNPVKSATKMIGKVLQKGAVVVYESTVYPGVTEDICVPLLEKESGLEYLKDFTVGFSPERINPADPINKLETIVKVVSASNEASLQRIGKIYETIIDAGLHYASSIKVAEASKVIENTQRDVNIAFMNELSIVFERLGINTKEVLEAAGTKWNFLPFSPGLVGGHCIGVDPYYLIYKAREFDITPKIMMATRELNDYMSTRVALKIINKLIVNKVNVAYAKVGIYGVTFKQNCPDTRNSKIVDLIEHLKSFGVKVVIFDEDADAEELKADYGLEVVGKEEMSNLDLAVVAVNHDSFKSWLTPEEIKRALKETEYRTVYDLKWHFDKKEIEDLKIDYWSL